MDTDKRDYLYRAEVSWDWDGNPTINMMVFPIIKETDRSYMVKRYSWETKLKRVPKEGRSVFARKTKEGAIKDCYHRRRHCIELQRGALLRSEEALPLLKFLVEGGDEKDYNKYSDIIGL